MAGKGLWVLVYTVYVVTYPEHWLTGAGHWGSSSDFPSFVHFVSLSIQVFTLLVRLLAIPILIISTGSLSWPSKINIS